MTEPERWTGAADVTYPVHCPMGRGPVNVTVRRRVALVTPMSPEEFTQRVTAFDRGGNKRGIIFLVWFFGGLLVLQPLASWADRIGGVGKAAVFALLLLFVAHPFLVLHWYGWRRQRRFGLLCPSCNRCLVGIGQNVKRTRSCKFCGTLVLAANQPVN